jgi:maltose O-acetyltransferase
MFLGNILTKRPLLREFLFTWYSFGKSLEITLINIALPPFRKIYFMIRMNKFHISSHIDYGFYFRYPNKIYIGKNVEINRNCAFYPSFLLEGGSIYIGNNVFIAPDVKIYCAGQSRNPITRENVASNIYIEDNTYIGAGSLIRYGVKIGVGATIAAGSVVVKDIPAGETHGGNPAKKIN